MPGDPQRGARALELDDLRGWRCEPEAEAPGLAGRGHRAVGPGGRMLRHVAEEAPAASLGKGAVPHPERVRAAVHLRLDPSPRRLHRVGEAALLPVDAGLGDRVDQQALGEDPILRAVDPVARAGEHAGVAEVRGERGGAVALHVGAVGRPVDRGVLHPRRGGGRDHREAHLRVEGAHVGQRGRERGDRAEVAGQEGGVAEGSLAAHGDPGDRVPAPLGPDPVALVDHAPHLAEVERRPGRAAPAPAVPPVHVHAEGAALRHHEDRREVPEHGRGVPAPRVGTTVGTVEQPQHRPAPRGIVVVALGQAHVHDRGGAALGHRPARLRRVDERRRQGEGVEASRARLGGGGGATAGAEGEAAGGEGDGQRGPEGVAAHPARSSRSASVRSTWARTRAAWSVLRHELSSVTSGTPRRGRERVHRHHLERGLPQRGAPRAARAIDAESPVGLQPQPEVVLRRPAWCRRPRGRRASAGPGAPSTCWLANMNAASCGPSCSDSTKSGRKSSNACADDPRLLGAEPDEVAVDVVAVGVEPRELRSADGVHRGEHPQGDRPVAVVALEDLGDAHDPGLLVAVDRRTPRAAASPAPPGACDTDRIGRDVPRYATRPSSTTS